MDVLVSVEHGPVVEFLLVHPHERFGESLADDRGQRLPRRGFVLGEPPAPAATSILCDADSVHAIAATKQDANATKALG